MPKLKILSGVLEGKVIDLIEERISMGRAVDNTVRLEDGTVSHHHAIVLVEGPEYKLRDLNSTNGTRVNGLRIVESKLHDGDAVRLGSVEMRFESDEKAASQPLPPMRTGIDLSEVGQGNTPPPTFSASSPFGRKKKSATNIWVWAILGLGVLAVLVSAFFVIRILSK
jgi:pSer/pThr/pTyr-binding forkhead associated (FHA) protein